jgi:hypothetical protein
MNCLSLHVPNEQIHVPVPEFEVIKLNYLKRSLKKEKTQQTGKLEDQSVH